MEVWVALASIIQGLTSIVAVIISVVTLRQTNKIQQDASKPYIVAYLSKIKVSDSDLTFLVIRNFGKTGATIKEVKTNPRLNNPGLSSVNDPIDNLKNQFIAPNQSFATGISISPSKGELKEEKFTVNIKYVDNLGKLQNNSFKLNTKAMNDLDHFATVPSNAKGVEEALYKLGSEYFITRL